MKKLFLLAVFLASNSINARDAEWLCEEEASQRHGDEFYSCGIGTGGTENDARLQALENAKKEFNSLCVASDDCHGHQVSATPKRTKCKLNGKAYVCHRLVAFKVDPTLKTSKVDESEPPNKPREPNPAASSNPATVKRSGQCSINVQSDPPGAAVSVENKPRGFTPTTVTLVCGVPIAISLKLSGFEFVSERIIPNRQNEDLYRNLRRIPLGVLELVLDISAEVYINGNLLGTADSNKVFERTLRAGASYDLKLVNKPYNQTAETKIQITEGKVSHYDIRLTDPTFHTNLLKTLPE